MKKILYFLILLFFVCNVIAEAKNRSSAFANWTPIDNNPTHLFDGDIKLKNGKERPLDRNAMTNKLARWPEGVVYYVLHETYSYDDIAVIKSAMEEFHKFTCIRWVERVEEENYVEIENDMGCWSELGSHGGIQTLSLESPLCMSKGVAMHEMMHTLGFLHEMSRKDRDEHILIHWSNLIPGMEDNFQKMSELEIDDLDLPYDHSSVMHYHAWAFSSDKTKPTISPKARGVSLNDLGRGQINGYFTENDVKKIRKFYECSTL